MKVEHPDYDLTYIDRARNQIPLHYGNGTIIGSGMITKTEFLRLVGEIEEADMVGKEYWGQIGGRKVSLILNHKGESVNESCCQRMVDIIFCGAFKSKKD